MIPGPADKFSFFSKWNPRVVRVGDIPIGGEFPVRIQSMINTPTLHTASAVAQCIRMIEAGCEFIRITTQSIREAEHLAVIKEALRKAGYSIPLIADVHFKPAVAEVAARLVEKVRINPGNFADKRASNAVYTETDYKIELERIAKNLYPLLKICKEYGTAIRIGTNHGSLSGRIMNRYGDTSEGMAESAMEFVRICNAEGFHKLVLSIKSSNVRVMIEGTRLLVYKMIEEDMQYPIHLGVTEAGNGLEGRIKSAAGIGSLLADGIGDIIRVSLTEAPENEIPVAKQIVSFYPKFVKKDIKLHQALKPDDFLEFKHSRRISRPAGNIGNAKVPVVLSDCDSVHSIDEQFQIEGNLGSWNPAGDKKNEDAFIHYLKVDPFQDTAFTRLLGQVLLKSNTALVFNVSTPDSISRIRKKISMMDGCGIKLPVLFAFDDNDPDLSHFAISAALSLAPLINDGLCDGVHLRNSAIAPEKVFSVAFYILQATRARITHTDYIACPGCGRTKFKIEDALEEVKSATSHLKGLKIAVMGCIVNGPGEMADADYGYVGQGSGKVSIYKGKTLVKRNVPEQEAVNELISVIKAHAQYLSP